MEHKPEIHNAFDSSKNGKVVDDLIKEWGPATSIDGVSRGGKIDDRRTVLGVSSMAGSGMPYPGVSRRPITGHQDGPQHQKSDRESPFNLGSKTEES